MGWLLKLLILLVVAAVAISIVIWVRREQKRRDLEGKLTSWVDNCSGVSPEDTIFVILPCGSSTPSSELLPTLESMFSQAFCPQRVSVGIVTSEGAADRHQLLFPSGESDRESYPYVSRFARHVRLVGAASDEGASPARAVGVRTLLLDERFLLLAHAHTAFLPAWDRTLVRDHGGVTKRVLTQRGELEGAPQFTRVLDVDADGMPHIGARPFRTQAVVPRETLFASTRCLFGLAQELRERALIGDANLRFAKPHVDDYWTTLRLRSRGFDLLAPTRPVLVHKSPSFAPSRHPWLPRLAVLHVHAGVALLCAESWFRKVLARPQALPLLSQFSAVPWVRVAVFSSVTVPSLLRAMRRAENSTDGETKLCFRAAGAKAVQAAKLTREQRQGLRRFLMQQAHKGKAGGAPGSSAWEAAVAFAIEVGRESLLGLVDDAPAAQDLFTATGVDPRNSLLEWPGAMGVAGGKEVSAEEIQARFGSLPAFELERSRWNH